MYDMEVKTFRAKSIQDALHRVQVELGPEASVLHTRRLPFQSIAWLLGGDRVEVSAAAVAVGAPSAPAESWRSTAWRPRAAFAAAGPAEGAGSLEEVGRELRTSPREEFVGRGEASGPRDAAFALYADLLDADVDEDSARQLIAAMQRGASAAEMSDLVLARARLVRQVEESLPIAPDWRVGVGGRRIVALVGPTGVGKTTTIAKLAANYRLKEGARVGLITVDNYRVAAVEQLRTYAEIIDLPLEVVANPRQMHEAVDRLGDVDLVMIDTAGRSPQDQIKIRELRAMLGEARADDVVLVLSASSSAAVLRRASEQFAVVEPTSLILTKLDETPSLGSLMGLFARQATPLRYVTTGQSVPHDIEAACAARLAQAIINPRQSGFGV